MAEWLADHFRGLGLDKVAVMETAGHPVVYGEWTGAGPDKPSECAGSQATLDTEQTAKRPEGTSVLELAETIWTKIKGPDVPFRYISDDPYEYDVQKRVPATQKAKDILGRIATLEVRLVDESAEARAAESGTGPVPFGSERYLERNAQPVIVKKPGNWPRASRGK